MPTSNFAAGVATNDLLLSYAPEADWGVKPEVAFKQLRVQSEGFQSSKTRTRPDEIQSTGQVSAAVTTKVESKGDIKFALSTAVPTDLLAASIMGVAGTAVNFANKATVAATATGFTDSLSGFVTGGVTAGAWIRVKGFAGANAGINGYYQVLTVAAGVITTLPAPPATAVAGDSVTFTGTRILNGTTVNSFFFQKQLAADLFLQYPGAVAIAGGVSAALGAFYSGDLSFLCKEEIPETTDGSTGAQVAAGGGDVINTIGGFGTIYRGATALDGTLQKIDMKWQQQSARMQYGMGSTGAAGFGKGLLDATGSMEVYFKNFNLYNEFIAEIGAMISFRGVDLNGAGFVFTIPNATIMNPSIVAGGPNQDVMATFQIEANPSAAGGIFQGKAFQIDIVT